MTSRRTNNDPLAGCPVHELQSKLRDARLRPTRQRIALGWLLFSKGDRHATAETLFEETEKARLGISLATVYNTLNQFTKAGLLRVVTVDGSRMYFDTNTSKHHHFLVEETNQLIDIPEDRIEFARLPDVFEGLEIAGIDVVVRFRPSLKRPR